MRKKMVGLVAAVMLILFLVSCSEKEVPVDPGVISYPGLAWNMTQEEVMKALDIDKADILPNGEESSPNQQAFCVENWEYLGQKGTILFEFWNETEDYFGLRRAIIFYPESANTDALEKEMTAMLGEGTPISDGKWLRWDSKKQYADYMEEGLAELKEKFPEKYEQRLEWSEGVPASFVTLHYDATDGTYINLAPFEGWDGEGSTISFYSNHMPLLQYAEFGLDIPE